VDARAYFAIDVPSDWIADQAQDDVERTLIPCPCPRCSSCFEVRDVDQRIKTYRLFIFVEDPNSYVMDIVKLQVRDIESNYEIYRHFEGTWKIGEI